MEGSGHNMPITQQDIDDIQERVGGLTEEGEAINQGAGGLPSAVWDAIRKDRATRGVSTMATDIGNTQQQLVDNPAGIEERLGSTGLVDPNTVNQLRSSERGITLNTLATQAYQSEYNQGVITDIITEQQKLLQAIAERKLADAQKAQVQLNNLMEKLKLEEDQRQFDETMAFDKEQANKKGSGSGGSSAIDKEFYSAVEDELARLREGSSWGEAFNRIKSRFPNKSDTDINSALGGSWNPETGETSGWAKPGSFEEWYAKLSNAKEGGSGGDATIMSEFGISQEDWNSLSEEQKQQIRNQAK